MHDSRTIRAGCLSLVVAFVVGQSGPAEDGRFVISLHGKHGYISRTGEIVIPPTLDGTYVIQFRESMARFAEAAEPRPDKLPFRDNRGRTQLFPPQKWGFIDTSGNKVIPAAYDAVGDFYEGFAAARINTEKTRYACLDCGPIWKWGFVDKKGSIVVQPQFHSVGHFSEGLAAVQNAELKWGYIDTSGRVVIPFQFESADEFGEGLAAVGAGDKIGFIDKTGGNVIAPRFTIAGQFSNGLAPVRVGGKSGSGEVMVRPGGKWVFIDTKGAVKVRLPKRVANVHSFKEGRAVVTFGAKCGYIDLSGAIVIKPTFSYCEDFSEALANVLTSGWQYIDPMGKIILRVDYSQVGPFVDGLAAVSVGEVGPAQRFGYINREGVEVYKPQLAL